MKTTISRLLSALSTLATVPTGWAIYAGVIKYPAFPMNTICAILGAVGVISTSIAAGMLVTDIKAYNQGLHNITERKDFAMSTTPAWLIFGGCVLAEITLSLLIVVIPGALAFGVLVFPLMTAAGVFAFAVKYDLTDREADLLKVRADKPKKSDAPAKPKKQSVAQVQAVPASATHYPRKCEHCDAQIKASQSVGGHMKKHHPELCKQAKPIGYNVSFEPVMKGKQ